MSLFTDKLSASLANSLSGCLAYVTMEHVPGVSMIMAGLNHRLSDEDEAEYCSEIAARSPHRLKIASGEALRIPASCWHAVDTLSATVSVNFWSNETQTARRKQPEKFSHNQALDFSSLLQHDVWIVVNPGARNGRVSTNGEHYRKTTLGEFLRCGADHEYLTTHSEFETTRRNQPLLQALSEQMWLPEGYPQTSEFHLWITAGAFRTGWHNDGCKGENIIYVLSGEKLFYLKGNADG